MRNNYQIRGNLVFIELKRIKSANMECVTSICFMDKLMCLDVTWFPKFSENPQKYYVCANKNGKTIYLHRYLLGVKDKRVVDHIDHNSMNNTEENLRISTNSQNNMHRKNKNNNNTSGYRNVCLIDGYYRIQLQVEGKNHLFKEKFDDIDDAGKFAKSMREKYYGDFSGNDYR